VRHAVENVLSGEYRSAFRGRGMEFDQVVKYEFGDDVRDIDWNVTARLGEPYRKKFVEEREVTLLLVFEDSPACSSAPARSRSARRCSNSPASSCCSAPSTATASASSTPRPTATLCRNPSAAAARSCTPPPRCSAAPRPRRPKKSAPDPVALPRPRRAAHSVMIWLGDFPPRAEPEGWSVLQRRYQTMGFRVDDPWERELPVEASFAAYDPVRRPARHARTAAPPSAPRTPTWAAQREAAFQRPFPQPAQPPRRRHRREPPRCPREILPRPHARRRPLTDGKTKPSPNAAKDPSSLLWSLACPP
jgi:hypothetical protein